VTQVITQTAQRHIHRFGWCRSNVHDPEQTAQAFTAMDTNADSRIDLAEFTAWMTAALEGLSSAAIDARMTEALDGRFGGRFHWDLHRCMCGNRGLLPLLDVLQRDATCESLDLSGCNLTSEGACALAAALSEHSVRLQPNLCMLAGRHGAVGRCRRIHKDGYA
jgi:hypothetical protein